MELLTETIRVRDASGGVILRFARDATQEQRRAALPPSLWKPRMAAWLADPTTRRRLLRLCLTTPDPRVGSDAPPLTRLRSSLERLLLAGTVLALREERPTPPGAPSASGRTSPPPPAAPPPTDEVRTWFALRVLDQGSQPVRELRVKVAVDGGTVTAQTDDAGELRVEASTFGGASAAVVSAEELRQILDGQPTPELRLSGAAAGVHIHSLANLPRSIALRPEAQVTLVITRPVFRARLIGMFFESDKSFRLPAAMTGIRGIRRLYDEHPRASLLAVGHADTAGEAAYNAALSLVRADAVAAFLTDDVAGWEAAL